MDRGCLLKSTLFDSVVMCVKSVLFNKPIPYANVELDSKWQQQHA
jgi:hypothetical protein